MRSVHKHARGFVLLLSGLLLLAVPAMAEVVRIEITSRELLPDLPDPPEPCEAMPYEAIKGLVHLTVDPENPANGLVHDLEFAPRNADGRVEFSTEFELYRPVDPDQGNHRLLYCVNNRGNKHGVGYFSNAYGHNWLVDQGWTYLWCGWNCDVIDSDRKLNIFLPICTDDGETITGRVYTEIVSHANDPVPSRPLVWGGSIPYLPASLDNSDAVLTKRRYSWTEPEVISSDRWSFARVDNGEVIPDGGHLQVEGGILPGWIYELVYTGKDPKPTGLGMAAIRDVVSFFRYEARDATGQANPLAGSIAHTYAWGHSQSARLLNHFVYEDFNGDERRRQVFDGILLNCGGGGKGQFNSRFAQMTRHGSHLEDNFYPIDYFPFTSAEQTDPVTGARGDNLARARAAGHLPKLMYINSATDYWTRAASLLHTDVEGKRDVAIDPEVRMYAVAGIAHTEGRIGVIGRALLTALDQWVSDGVQPPASRVPRIDDGTLVDLDSWLAVFPDVPDVRKPASFYHPIRLDPGPRWANEGIMDILPPAVGPRYVCLVPQVDAAGNEIAGIRLPEVAVPLATFTGWYHRNPAYSLTLGRNAGRVWPLPATVEARRESSDPRASIQELYPTSDSYRIANQDQIEDLYRQRFLLAEDRRRLLDLTALQAELIADLWTFDEILAQEDTDATTSYAHRIQAAGLEWWYGGSLIGSINYRGYELIWAGDLQKARAVFELNTMIYPDDFNVWDSLGECCLEQEDFASARRYYERSLELNPGNENGRQMLQRIADR